MAEVPTLHEQVMERMKSQLVIALIKRLINPGEDLVIPVSEIDATGQDLLMMSVDTEDRTFTFRLKKKS